MSMVTIKESIELLLRILRSFGFTKLKAEVFRLAKFDDPSSTPALWRLLFEGVYFCRYASIDEVCARAFSEFSSREIVKYVKRELQRRGYLSRDFDALDADMESGSRELLLAFGWLMCKEALVHQLCVASVQPLLEGRSLESLLDREATAGRLGDGGSGGGGSSAITQDVLKRMVWLNGRMRMNLKQLHWMRRERVGLDGRIHAATLGLGLEPGREHLSSTEVYLLKHPELLSKNLQLLEKDNERLQSLLKWRSHEDEFWRWMESVLDLKLQEVAVTGRRQEPVCAPEAEEEEETASSVMSAAERRLACTVEKYESVVELLERQWSLKTLNVTRAELDLMISAVDDEIQSFSLFVMKRSPRPTSQPPACVVLDRQQVRQGLEQLLPNTASNVEREVGRLEGILSKLEKDVESNYAAFNDQLQTISKFTNSMVLQDPLST